MSNTAPQLHTVLVGSEHNVAVGFSDLPSGVLLTGTPTVAEQTTSDLTLAGAAVNSAAVTIDGTSYGAGTAVVFHLSGGSAGTEYTIRITVNTDAATPDVLVGDVKIRYC